MSSINKPEGFESNGAPPYEEVKTRYSDDAVRADQELIGRIRVAKAAQKSVKVGDTVVVLEDGDSDVKPTS